MMYAFLSELPVSMGGPITAGKFCLSDFRGFVLALMSSMQACHNSEICCYCMSYFYSRQSFLVKTDPDHLVYAEFSRACLSVIRYSNVLHIIHAIRRREKFLGSRSGRDIWMAGIFSSYGADYNWQAALLRKIARLSGQEPRMRNFPFIGQETRHPLPLGSCDNPSRLTFSLPPSVKRREQAILPP
jgi:hypothetical protein